MTSGRTISAHSIKQRVGPKLKPYWVTSGAKYAGFGDTQYYLLTKAETLTLLKSREIEEGRGELFDCDDFAFASKAFIGKYTRLSNNIPAPLCFGIVWGRFKWVGGGKIDHACNWFFTRDYEFWWYEPQNSDFFESKQCVRRRLKLLLV